MRSPYEADADRVSDILEAVAKIRERITDSIDTFQSDEMLQVRVIHHLRIIGEAARGVPNPSKAVIPNCRGRKSLRCGTFWCMSTSASICSTSGP